jgi:hypothetical protein
MSSAKWQRHSTFLSVRWRTWIGRALSSSGPAVGCRPPAAGQGGASTGRPVVAPHRKKAGFSAGDMATPGQLPGSARNAGRFLSLSGVNAYPRPIQQPFPELVIGGHTPGAYRRSVEQGNGWYGFGLDLAHIAGLARRTARRRRSVRPPKRAWFTRNQCDTLGANRPRHRAAVCRSRRPPTHTGAAPRPGCRRYARLREQRRRNAGRPRLAVA